MYVYISMISAGIMYAAVLYFSLYDNFIKDFGSVHCVHVIYSAYSM